MIEVALNLSVWVGRMPGTEGGRDPHVHFVAFGQTAPIFIWHHKLNFIHKPNQANIHEKLVEQFQAVEACYSVFPSKKQDWFGGF